MENVVGRDGMWHDAQDSEGFEDLGQEFERIIDAGDDHAWSLLACAEAAR